MSIPQYVKPIVSCVAMTACLATAIASAALIYRDNRDAAVLARAALKPLRVDHDVVSVGTLRPGQKAKATFLLSNDGDQPLKIFGASAGCVCTLPSGIPFTISAADSKEFVIEYTAPASKPRPISAPVKLFTNSAAQPELELSIRGTLAPTFP